MILNNTKIAIRIHNYYDHLECLLDHKHYIAYKLYRMSSKITRNEWNEIYDMLWRHLVKYK
jgi:hypothetical protein